MGRDHALGGSDHERWIGLGLANRKLKVNWHGTRQGKALDPALANDTRAKLNMGWKGCFARHGIAMDRNQQVLAILHRPRTRLRTTKRQRESEICHGLPVMDARKSQVDGSENIKQSTKSSKSSSHSLKDVRISTK